MIKAQSLAIILSLLLAAPSAWAEFLTTFRCSYTRQATRSGVAQLQKQFELTFIIDAEANATVTGNVASTSVTALPKKSGDGITFIEITPSGNVMTTTIDSTGKSVHSRHTVIAGELMPSQYYGSCH